MLARVADSLYWIGRYLERSDHTARLLAVHLDMMLYQTGEDVDESWNRLASIVLEVDLSHTAPDPMAISRLVAEDPDNPDSLVNCIGGARENARQVREVISSEMWSQINRLYLRSRQMRLSDPWEDPQTGYFRSLQEAVTLFEGVSDSTFSHGEGWHFLRLGRFLERAIATAQILQVNLREIPTDDGDSAARHHHDSRWLGLLRSCAALEAFIRAHTADPRPRLIAEFLMFDAEFPHSLRFAVESACSAIEQLSRMTGSGAVRSAGLAQSSGRLRAQLEYADAEEILRVDPGGYLQDVADQLSMVHDLVYASYTGYDLTESATFA